MKQSGRASFLTILAVAAVLLVGGLLLFGRESLTSLGSRFMYALAAGDVNTLTKMSYLGNGTEEEMKKKWDFTVNRAGKYYIFAYRIVSARQSGPESAQVTMQVIRDAATSGGYEQKFELPLIKVGDEWKVDVGGISREMYPGLPR